MWDNGSPTGGGSGGSGGGSTPATPATPARCTAPGTTRATLNSRAQKVWLQAVDQLSATCADQTQIANVIQSRLQSLFTLVANRPGPPQHIQVIWTTNISSETVGSRDIVIYFVNWYASGNSGPRGTNGVVERYLRGRQAATSGAMARAYDSLRRTHFDNRTTPTEGGMCVCDTDNTPPATRGTSCSEVYADRMIHANAIPDGVSNRNDFVNNQGFAMAGMAFHEAMHNKIDPFKSGSWDLHNLAGGGLARGNFGGGQQHTTADIVEMGNYINRVRGQYILPASTPATTTPAAPATPGSATPSATPARP